jgi:hypothetical protein
MTPGDLDALAAALELPAAAAREQRLHLARGKRRARNSGPKAGQLTLAAAIARQRHGIPCRLLGQLLGADESTISLATCRITPLLAQHGITIAPAGSRIRSLDDLSRHAAAAGVTTPGRRTRPQKPHYKPAAHRKPTLFRDVSPGLKIIHDHENLAIHGRPST